ncbi:MAG: hybrid sensor histidine kinase/response regulator [Thermonemataceae bacterium]
MNVHLFRQQYIAQKSSIQVVILSPKGTLIDSCDTLIPLKASYQNTPILHQLTFLSGLESTLTQITTSFSFPQVHLNEAPFKEGVYNLSFAPISYEGEASILWTIEDISEDFVALQGRHQEGRVALLEKEVLEIQHQKVALEKQLLTLQKQELERARDFKNYFFSQVNHEIRSPIQGIVGLAELMINSYLSRENRTLIRGIHTAAKYLQVIVNDVLDIGKIEAGKMSIECTSFSLKKILAHIELSFLPVFKEKEITLVIQLDKNLPDILYGDPTRLTQIFYNLISNAVKFTKEGQVSVTIKVDKPIENLADEQVVVSCTIEDTGKGMPPEQTDTLFQPFSQGKASTYRLFGGTGLGLTVVKQLVELMEGSISVESRLGEGTRFYLCIPLQVVLLKETNQDIEVPNSSHIFQHLKVLVADDNAVLLLYIKKLLEEKGVQVATARDGVILCQKLEQQDFDAILTDWHMPRLQGEELITAIRKITADTPVVIISGTENLETLRAHNQQVDGYLVKPFESVVLFELLHTITQTGSKEDITLDLKKIEENALGDPSFMVEMIATILTDLESDWRVFEQAFEEKAWREMQKIIHKMRPTGVLIGNEAFVDLIDQIEQAILRESGSLKIQAYAESLEHLVKRIQATLHQRQEALKQPKG